MLNKAGMQGCARSRRHVVRFCRCFSRRPRRSSAGTRRRGGLATAAGRCADRACRSPTASHSGLSLDAMESTCAGLGLTLLLTHPQPFSAVAEIGPLSRRRCGASSGTGMSVTARSRWMRASPAGRRRWPGWWIRRRWRRTSGSMSWRLYARLHASRCERGHIGGLLLGDHRSGWSDLSGDDRSRRWGGVSAFGRGASNTRWSSLVPTSTHPASR